MHKTTNCFEVVVKDGVIQQIGRSYIMQPVVRKPEKKRGQQHERNY